MDYMVRDEIKDYALRSTGPEPELQIELTENTGKTVGKTVMLTDRTVGRLMKILVAMVRPRLVLELGTFTGYSALNMAEGLPEDGRIITSEIDPEHARIAREAFDASPYGDKIEIRIGPALETIRGIEDPIDFSFIDADKIGYPQYYEEVLARTRPGGIILFDNMFLDGRVLNPEDEAARVIDRLNWTVAEDDRVENVFLTIRDGLQLVRKLPKQGYK
jgi:predicted O-methyltransferase YrrM